MSTTPLKKMNLTHNLTATEPIRTTRVSHVCEDMIVWLVDVVRHPRDLLSPHHGYSEELRVRELEHSGISEEE
jgi:hypothetical protein